MRSFNDREQRLLLLLVGIFVTATGVLLFAPDYTSTVPLTIRKAPPVHRHVVARATKTRAAVRRVNPNFASQEELETLPGVGETIARRIVDYRSRHIYFSIKDLERVSGIGAHKARAMASYLVFAPDNTRREAPCSSPIPRNGSAPVPRNGSAGARNLQSVPLQGKGAGTSL